MQATIQKDDVWYGERDGEIYPIYDAQAGYFADLWARLSPQELIETVLKNTALWGHDLAQLPGFGEAVSTYLKHMVDKGVLATLSAQFDHLETVTK